MTPEGEEPKTDTPLMPNDESLTLGERETSLTAEFLRSDGGNEQNCAATKDARLSKGPSGPPAPPSPPGLDGGYGWVVVVAAFLSCWVIGMSFIAFSILYRELRDHFHSNYGSVGWIGSLYLAIGNILGVVFSAFVKYYGCRAVCMVGGLIWAVGFAASSLAPTVGFLYVSYGLVAGMGFNMVTLSSFVVVQQYFTRHRALAAGLASTGISLGTLSSGPLVAALITAYGWRGTLLLIAAMTLNSCVFGALYRPIRPPRPSSPAAAKEGQLNGQAAGCELKTDEGGSLMAGGDGENVPLGREKTIGSDDRRTGNGGKMADANRSAVPTNGPQNLSHLFLELLHGTTDLSIFLNPAFSLCCVGTFFMNFGSTIFYQHTVNRALDEGVYRPLAVLLPTAVGVATALARFGGGLIGNLACTNRTLQYGVTILVSGAFLAGSAHAYTFLPIAVLGAAIGALVGLSLTVQTTVLTDLVGVEHIARAQAFTLLVSGFSALVAVPLAGFIVDRTGNYSIPFYLGALMQAVGGVHVIGCAVVQRTRNKRLCITVE